VVQHRLKPIDPKEKQKLEKEKAKLLKEISKLTKDREKLIDEHERLLEKLEQEKTDVLKLKSEKEKEIEIIDQSSQKLIERKLSLTRLKPNFLTPFLKNIIVHVNEDLGEKEKGKEKIFFEIEKKDKKLISIEKEKEFSIKRIVSTIEFMERIEERIKEIEEKLKSVLNKK